MRQASSKLYAAFQTHNLPCPPPSACTSLMPQRRSFRGKHIKMRKRSFRKTIDYVGNLFFVRNMLGTSFFRYDYYYDYLRSMIYELSVPAWCLALSVVGLRLFVCGFFTAVSRPLLLTVLRSAIYDWCQ